MGMFDTRLRGRYDESGLAQYTSWRSAFGSALVSMMWLGLLLLVLSLMPGCAWSLSDKPLETHEIAYQLEFWESKEALTAECKRAVEDNKNHPPLAPLLSGCRIWDGTSNRILMTKPRDWCDAERLFTLGHETMHTIGWRHALDHYTSRWAFTGVKCDVQVQPR
jgi:hypothetical protein